MYKLANPQEEHMKQLNFVIDLINDIETVPISRAMNWTENIK